MNEGRWLSEREVAEHSGLPGPMVHDLLPRLPTPLGVSYHSSAEVYASDAVWRARIAVLLLNLGVRIPLIRLAMQQPRTRQQMEAEYQQFAPMYLASQVAGRTDKYAIGMDT